MQTSASGSQRLSQDNLPDGGAALRRAAALALDFLATVDGRRVGASAEPRVGAVLPERSRVTFKVNEPAKRPVSVVADQKEFRDVAEVHLEIARENQLTLLFDPGHALDERIVAEQFAV